MAGDTVMLVLLHRASFYTALALEIQGTSMTVVVGIRCS